MIKAAFPRWPPIPRRCSSVPLICLYLSSYFAAETGGKKDEREFERGASRGAEESI